MPDGDQDSQVQASGGDAANVRDIEATDGSQVNVQSEVKRHSKPKPHNEQGTGEFNGIAFLFQVLSNYVPAKYFDGIFGTSTVGSLLVVGYWFWTGLYSNFPDASVTVPKYVIFAFGVALVGGVYLSVREQSQCPQCESLFALWREEREVERDKLQGKPDDLLIRRKESCSKCGYEDEFEFWKLTRNNLPRSRHSIQLHFCLRLSPGKLFRERRGRPMPRCPRPTGRPLGGCRTVAPRFP